MSDNGTPLAEGATGLGRVSDHRTTPPGVMPRHLQQWVLVATALGMAAIMAIAGPSSKPRPTAAPSPGTATVNPNQERIEEYERRIQEQTERLAAEQVRVQRARQAVAMAEGQRVAAPTQEPADGSAAARRSASASSPSERLQRDEHARFADNV